MSSVQNIQHVGASAEQVIVGRKTGSRRNGIWSDSAESTAITFKYEWLHPGNIVQAEARVEVGSIQSWSRGELFGEESRASVDAILCSRKLLQICGRWRSGVDATLRQTQQTSPPA